MKDELVKLRRRLHSKPELAHKEESTSGSIRAFLEKIHPDRLVTGIGGFGVAAIFSGEENGPTVMLRCELDALPIPETVELPYASTTSGISHKCGHDGHMAVMAGVALSLGKKRPARGTVVLLFQPAEETGEGAALVLSDPKYREFHPDYVFALHNLPGFPLGHVVTNKSTFASTSTGLVLDLHGSTSHAAEPEAGRSPAMAVAQLIQGLSSIPQFHTKLHDTAQVTVIHAVLGEVAFGTSPGEGKVLATLRSYSQEVMDVLIARSTSLAKGIAGAYDLQIQVSTTQVFPSTVNDPEAVSLVERSAHALHMDIHERTIPFAWSEDFGHFTSRYKGAMFGLGAGEDHPAIHHPDYDFPEELIEPGIAIFMNLIQTQVG